MTTDERIHASIEAADKQFTAAVTEAVTFERWRASVKTTTEVDDDSGYVTFGLEIVPAWRMRRYDPRRWFCCYRVGFESIEDSTVNMGGLAAWRLLGIARATLTKEDIMGDAAP